MVSKIIATSFAISSLMIFAEQADQSFTTARDFASYVQAHVDDPLFFKKINYSLEVKAIAQFNFEKWRSLVHSFVDLLLLANRDIANNGKWVGLLGYPFKDLIDLSGEKTGIHGDLNMDFAADSFTLSGIFERTDQSAAETWKQVVRIWSDVADRAAQTIEKGDYEWNKGVGEIIVTALKSSSDGIKSVIRLNFEETNGNNVIAEYSSN